jgi:hypothetical protein
VRRLRYRQQHVAQRHWPSRLAPFLMCG